MLSTGLPHTGKSGYSDKLRELSIKKNLKEIQKILIFLNSEKLKEVKNFKKISGKF